MEIVNTPLATLLGVLLLMPACRVAAESAQYDIELLVFENLVNSDNGENLREIHSDRLAADNGPDGSTTVSWLSAANYRMAAQEASMRGSAQYRPIAHLAWRQTVEDREHARPVDLSAQTDKVDGTVTVALGRYLHLSLDLALRSDADEGAWPEPSVSHFQLVEQRRMRSKEIHYLDHPRFGVLALITPTSADR